MVFTNKYTETLISSIPGFSECKWLKKEELCYFGDEENINIDMIFTALTRYVVYEVTLKNISITQTEKVIYKYVESVINEYRNYAKESDEFKFANAACVSFLENLLNMASSERIRYDRFIPYLGEKSKAFCKEWDKFTGVRSPGLWTDKEWEESNK